MKTHINKNNQPAFRILVAGSAHVVTLSEVVEGYFQSKDLEDAASLILDRNAANGLSAYLHYKGFTDHVGYPAFFDGVVDFSLVLGMAKYCGLIREAGEKADECEFRANSLKKILTILSKIVKENPDKDLYVTLFGIHRSIRLSLRPDVLHAYSCGVVKVLSAVKLMVVK